MGRNPLSKERGMALVIALLLMVLVTIIGISAIGMTVDETSTSGDGWISVETIHEADGKGPVSQLIGERSFR